MGQLTDRLSVVTLGPLRCA